MRIIAIDLGDKRTGLALGDRITNIATPLDLVEIPIDEHDGSALLDALTRRINDSGPDTTILLGLPLNMDDTEGPRAALARDFAQRLADRADKPVTLIDERRSSLGADESMSRSGLTHKQKKLRRDAIAATKILETYLEDPTNTLGTVTPQQSRRTEPFSNETDLRRDGPDHEPRDPHAQTHHRVHPSPRSGRSPRPRPTHPKRSSPSSRAPTRPPPP